jgi:hypothetical protein
MTMILNDQQDLTIPFPRDKYQALLKQAGVTTDPPTVTGIHKVFVLAVRAFESGEISPDDLAEIAGRLLNRLDRRNPQFQYLADTLDAAGEISFYVRQSDSKMYGSLLKSIREFVKLDQ